MECELKLRLGRPQDAARLIQHAALRGAATARLASRYFDTPDFRLAQAGISLRLREKKGRHEITLKAEGRAQGGLSERPEWTAARDENRLDLDALPAPAQKILRKALGNGSVQEIFKTEILRRSKTIRHKGHDIEIALDEGWVKAGRKKTPIHELELEWTGKGDAATARAALHDLARLLSRQAALIPEARAKAQRGLACAGFAPPPVRRKPVELDDGADARAALAAIVGQSLQGLMDHEPLAMQAQGAEGVHQMRVNARRLRAGLRLFARALPKRDASRAALDALHEETGDLARALGTARGLDVFAQDLLPRLDLGQAARKTILARCSLARDAAYAEVRVLLSSAEYGRLLLSLGRWADAPPAMEGAPKLRKLARDAIAHRHAQVMNAGERMESLNDDELHDLRLRIKKLRYVIDFFRSLYPAKAILPWMKGLARLQEDLGALNDAVEGPLWLDRIAPARADAQWERAAAEATNAFKAQAQADRKKLKQHWKRLAGLDPCW